MWVLSLTTTFLPMLSCQNSRGLTPPAMKLHVHLYQMQKNAKIPEDITTSGIVIIGHFRLLTQNIETLVLVLYHNYMY